MKQYLRAYEPCDDYPKFVRKPQNLPLRVLVFDTETDTDLEQKLRVGAYQLRVAGRIVQSGVFYPGSSLEAFRTLFERVSKDSDSAIIGFNLPFDIARIASKFGEARGSMQGGFSFTISPDSMSRVRIKYLGSKKSIITWGGKFKPQGSFVDCSTLGKALTGRSHSLASLAVALDTEHRKLDASHGGELDSNYLEYLERDVQVTWECYELLAYLWSKYKLGHTHISRVYSEASVGKAALREMNIRPFSEVNANVSNNDLGAAMESFYGGRSEVHIRRESRDTVYVDFLSMYPTVCTLLGLWKFVTARQIGVVHNARNTSKIAEVLSRQDLSSMFRAENWRNLHSIVRIESSGDLLPIRADYSPTGGSSIGLNYLQTAKPIWYTLADAIASKILTGKAPKITDAITLVARGTQSKLEPWAIMGDDKYNVDPNTNDFYKRLIELRATTDNDERLALKLVANSTCYGIFAELNERRVRGKSREYVTGTSSNYAYRAKLETPGLYHNPFLATFITGAARLLLATLERKLTDDKLDWILCDTDSMSISVSTTDDRLRVSDIVDSYSSLNPYKAPIENILKIEYGETEQTFAFAISAKRYCLYSGSTNNPHIVKASAHGLGHLRSPDGDNRFSAGAPKWIIPVWEAMIIGSRAWIDYLNKIYDVPAMSQFSVTGPSLLRYGMLPYSFASVFRVKPNCVWPNVGVAVAPYGTDARKTALGARLIGSGGTVDSSYLYTYREALTGYLEHPESKFQDGAENGVLARRYVNPTSFVYIGKEAGNLEAKTHGLEQAAKPYGERSRQNQKIPPLGTKRKPSSFRRNGYNPPKSHHWKDDLILYRRVHK